MKLNKRCSLVSLYSGSFRISIIELFCENDFLLKAVSYFRANVLIMDGWHAPIYTSERVRPHWNVHLVCLILLLQYEELRNFDDHWHTREKKENEVFALAEVHILLGQNHVFLVSSIFMYCILCERYMILAMYDFYLFLMFSKDCSI